MRGSALALEPAVRSLPPPPPEILVTTDFLNLPEFLALTRDLWPRPIPSIVYFHENQLTYPASSSDIRDFHFGLVNIYSALAADRVLFNSEFHRDEFLSATEVLLREMPDFRPEGTAERIRDRSEVLGLPLDLEEMEAARAGRPDGSREPWVVWNHRWEEDRNPSEFFRAMEGLDALARDGRAPDFRIVVVGQTYQNRPPAFEEARRSLSHRIVKWGYVESRREYLELLGRSAVVVSTSHHEFFGVSVMEAVYMGCAPVLPRRLTYPAIACGRPDLLYEDPAEIPGRVARHLEEREVCELEPLRERIRGFDSRRVIRRWDRLISAAGPAPA
jgi:glycosyltransferase involved in cell wall biosynthesis